MEWICGVKYTPSGFCLKTINAKKMEHVRPVSELQSVLEFKGKTRAVNGNTTFSDWRELTAVETDALAKQLKFPAGRNGQTFYEFEADSNRYIIPAGVLMCAMFRPFHGISKYVFAPQGLDNLCMPYGNCEKPELMFFVHPRTAAGIQADKGQGILNSLSWMHCFPTARKMWSSVLEYARKGVLGLKLPTGKVKFAGSGRRMPSGAILIQSFRIRLLETSEEPLELYSMHTRLIEFERILHKINAPKIERTCQKDNTIPLRDGHWQLTDAEWAAMEKFVVIKHRKGASEIARKLIDLQLQRFSQGLSWACVSNEKRELLQCKQFHARMKADGRWTKLIDTLTEFRCTAAT